MKTAGRPLHVLVYGTLDAGASDLLRVGVMRAPLAGLGVELRTWDEQLAGPLAEAPADDPTVMLEPIRWADVIVFRRWRSTAPRCTECGTSFDTTLALADHVAATAHRTLVPDPLLRMLVTLLVRHPEVLGGRALVYDTDDDILAYPDWTGFGRAALPETDLVETLLRRADLVTVASPALATMAGRYNDAVRLVRNAVEPAWYVHPGEGALPEPGTLDGGAAGDRPAGDPRIGYYGVPVRLRDYALARDAVETLVAERPAARRVWLGAAHDRSVRAAMDEVHPYTDGVPAFARALAALRLDIGLAPVRDEPFNRAKSELHWLEYTLAGAATIASRTTAGPGPYDVIADGRDGLLVTDTAGWLAALRSLAASPDRRAELTGRARERILATYTVERRAPEWAAAYRWAADHAGRGIGR